MIRTLLERTVSAHGSRLALSVGVTDFWTYTDLFDRIRATAEELTNVASDEVMHSNIIVYSQHWLSGIRVCTSSSSSDGQPQITHVSIAAA